MAPALGVSARQSHRRTLTTDDLQTVLVRDGVRLGALHAGSHFHRGPGIRHTRSGELVKHLDAPEVVHPEGQAARAGGFGVIVVAGVADDEADVVLFHEVNGLRDVFWFADDHGVANKVAERAGLGDGMVGVASAIGEEGRHN